MLGGGLGGGVPQRGPLTQYEGSDLGEQRSKEQEAKTVEGATGEQPSRRRGEQETEKVLTQPKISLFLHNAEYNAIHQAGMQPSKRFPSVDMKYKNDCETEAVVRSSIQEEDRNQERPDADVILEEGGGY